MIKKKFISKMSIVAYEVLPFKNKIKYFIFINSFSSKFFSFVNIQIPTLNNLIKNFFP